MPATLDPPKSLEGVRYFVLRYARDTEKYELLLPDRAESFIIGDAFATRRYFERIKMEYIGGRAIDSATAFGASQAIPGENRAFGLDLLKVNLDAGIIKSDQELDNERLLGIDDGADPYDATLVVGRD